MSNAVQFKADNQDGYLVYDTSGDLLASDSIYHTFYWNVIPTGTHGTTTPVFRDSTSADGWHHTTTTSWTYEGTERITDSSGIYDAIRVRYDTRSIHISSKGTGYEDSTQTYYWFVQTLGFFYKVNVKAEFINIDGVNHTVRTRAWNTIDLIEAYLK
jgi:hypothetical protein